MNPKLQRALMLLQQSRLELAEQEIGQRLVEAPDDAMAHALLALCHSQAEKHREASAEAEEAVRLGPDIPFVFFAHSVVLTGRNKNQQAKQAIQQAIELDPYIPLYFSQLAQVELNLSQPQAALKAAEEGLALEPDNVDCTNIRALALRQLGRQAEASSVVGAALERAPNDATTHANMGWSLLQERKPEKAMEHFRESLRLEPNFEWARRGIVEAMKARYFVYRWILAWFLWMNRLQQKARWTVIIGAYVVYRVLLSISRNNPQLAPWITPILVLYGVFVVTTWLATPLFNLVLRTNKFGRLALSKQEIRTSNWVGLCVLGCLALLIPFFVTGSIEFAGSALACALIIPPLANTHSCQPGWPRATIILVTIALGAMAGCIIASSLLGLFLGGRTRELLLGVAGLLFVPFVISALLSQFLVSFLASVRPIKGTHTERWVWVIGGSLIAIGVIALVGLVAAALLVGSVDNINVFPEPIRTEAIAVSSEDWAPSEPLLQDMRTLEDAGFTTIGDYRLAGLDGIYLRLMQDEEKRQWAELVEGMQGKYVVSLSGAFDDGRAISVNNALEPPLTSLPNLVSIQEDGDVLQLKARLAQAADGEAFRTFSTAELLDFLVDLFHERTDQLLREGGPTADAIRAIAASHGNTVSDDRIALIQTLWRQQACGKLETYAIQRLRDEGQTESEIVVIHDLLGVKQLRELFRTHDLPPPQEALAEPSGDPEADRPPGGAAQWFAKYAEDHDLVTPIATWTEPLSIDIYSISSGSPAPSAEANPGPP
ncbi:MAG: tetratricopeptide repeat protein [Planctomycetota bacterium]